MTAPVRHLDLSRLARVEGEESLLTREWLVTNGLGGYASGTLGSVPTRRYHGLLVAALPAPFGRFLMWNGLTERIRLQDGTTMVFDSLDRIGVPLEVQGSEYLEEFRLELGLPVWRYRIGDVAFERRIVMHYRQNSVSVQFHLLSGAPLRLKIRPTIRFRPHDAPVSPALGERYALRAADDRYELTDDSERPPLRLRLEGRNKAFTYEPKVLDEIRYRVEEHRGYEHKGAVWTPGYFRADLSEGEDVTLVGSTESWEGIEILTPRAALEAELERRRRLLEMAHPAARTGVGSELVLAADQFIVTPTGRLEEAARLRAVGDEARTVIAGYHWFTDWGRDTMISLEGLTLATGRHAEAGAILRTFAQAVRDGLIPNLYPEGGKEGLYHTADATLWFFHALDRYLETTEDRATLRLLFPRLQEIVERHLEGTRFGIGVDGADGLLRQGEEGFQLTWMDAKVGDWVVTPRRGKAVEINALWYNALRLLQGWAGEEGEASLAGRLSAEAERAYRSFNRRFWYEAGGYLYDVVDGEEGDDASFRPNQVLSISLKHPVLERTKWSPLLRRVRERLLTPVGLRSLGPDDPRYKARYFGDLRARDAAYHQGTVWAWLIGPYLDAWLKLHPEDRTEARGMLEGFEAHLDQACIGSISEIFDAEAPYTSRGCVAQAWSVAELLRCWIQTSEDQASS